MKQKQQQQQVDLVFLFELFSIGKRKHSSHLLFQTLSSIHWGMLFQKIFLIQLGKISLQE